MRFDVQLELRQGLELVDIPEVLEQSPRLVLPLSVSCWEVTPALAETRARFGHQGQVKAETNLSQGRQVTA